MTLTVETLAALLQEHQPNALLKISAEREPQIKFEWYCSCGYEITDSESWAKHVALGLLPQLGAGAPPAGLGRQLWERAEELDLEAQESANPQYASVVRADARLLRLAEVAVRAASSLRL